MTIDNDDQLVIDYIHDQQELRDIDNINRQEEIGSQFASFQQLRGVLHRQDVDPARLGWQTGEGLRHTLENTTYQSDYVIDRLNHRATSSGTGTTKWLTPIERRGEPTPDLSKFRFGFGEKVVFFAKQPFPRSGLRIGRSLGPAKEGNYLCQRILTSEGQVISRSAVESVARSREKDSASTITPQQS